MFSEVLVCSCLLSFGDKLGLCRQGEGRGDKNLGEGTTLFLASGVLASVFYSFIQVLFGGDLVAKSCLTLVTPMDCSPAGSHVHGISQARSAFTWLNNQSPELFPSCRT